MERDHRDRDRDSDDSEDHMSGHQYYNRNPSNTIIVLGLQSHITEADVSFCNNLQVYNR